MRYFLFCALAISLFCSCSAGKNYSLLQKELDAYVEGKDARIGIAAIFDGKDTVQVNGNRDFPMLSVYKFPQAIAIADTFTKHGLDLDCMISISADDMKPNTWSPMREKYGRNDLLLSLREVLTYSLAQSDNNACDILFNLIGGPEVADSIMKSMGYDDIVIVSTEDEMHNDVYLCYQNRSTPIGMARLFDAFYRQGLCNENPIMEEIGKIMIDCRTGMDRLPKPLQKTDIPIGHKTGTGDKNTQGRFIGINDAGYVFLPNDHGYAIAVFVADSACDMETTEKMIADISEIVYNFSK